ncbi:putative peptidyl-tRNA hydrolase 2 [Halotydeus destructor]|nr:putative peptidyl-tRNA hydrolase 2 [Halotydeus destructor]
MADAVDRGIADGAEREDEGSGAAAAAAMATTTPKTTMTWEPNHDLLNSLTGMGISSVAAKKALFYTGNQSAELAASWIFENPEADLETPLEVEASRETMSAEARERSRHTRDIYKMVFVVNSSLEMGVGKIAAQVAHAALGVHQILLQSESKYGEWLLKWYDYGETKIVLKGETTNHLIQLEKKAMEVGLPCYLVQDAGKTQVPAGSTTVLVLFGRVEVVDTVTGGLRLL